MEVGVGEEPVVPEECLEGLGRAVNVSLLGVCTDRDPQSQTTSPHKKNNEESLILADEF